LKKLILLFAIAIIALSAVSCGEKTESGSESTSAEPFKFSANNVDIKFGEPSADMLSALGKEQKFFEAPTCAFEGGARDKKYSYGSFEITTYQDKKLVDRVLSAEIKDDSLSTPEGITIGSTFEQVKTAYGTDFKQSTGFYTFTKGKTSLKITIDNDTVTAINYLYDVL